MFYVLLLGILYSSIFSEVTWAAPPTLTYQGRIVRSDGRPVEHNSVSFEFSITTPDGVCVLYREQRNGVDMQNSKGVFDTPIGTGAMSFPTNPATTILDVFSNSVASLPCEGGSTYNPALTDGRKLRVRFWDGTGWYLITPDSTIRSVPFAAHAAQSTNAKYFDSLGLNSFVLKSQVPTCISGEVLTSTAAGILTCTPDIGSGAGTAGGDLSGTYPNPTVSKILNRDLLFSALTSGQFLKYNGSSWVNSSVGLASEVTGTLPIANGGTAATTALGAFNNLSPLTTKGDLLAHNGVNSVRLPVGSNGKFLKADSSQASGVIWEDAIATDLSSIVGTGIIQRDGPGSYSTVTVAAPLTYSGGVLGLSAGAADFKADGSIPMTGSFKASAGTVALPSITFQGDPDTGFRNDGLNNLYVSTGGTERGYFDGLGTLNWYGNIVGSVMRTTLNGSVTVPSFSFVGDTNTGLYTPGANSDILAITTGGVERMRVDASGNVGIGASPPAGVKLDVRGTIRSVSSTGTVHVNSSSSVDWSLGNNQSMDVDCATTTFTNFPDGATCKLLVSETSASTCVFSHAGLTFLYAPANGPRTLGQQTIYSFTRFGSTVVVVWSALN